MYQQNYSNYHQPMRPPSHPHGPPPPLHIQTAAPPQARYNQYPMSVPPQSGSMPPSQPVPQSPSAQSDRTSEEDYYNLPGPPPTSHVWNGYVWALEVVQHPQRARMCGFGDKDRRPISPPPCIRLIIMDPVTHKEVDYADVDLTHLVLTVDIWDMYAQRELNLVKQSNASPCISSAATGSFPTTASTQLPAGHQPPQAYDIQRVPAYNHYNSQTPMTASPSPAGSYFSGNGQQYQNGRTPYMNGQSGSHAHNGHNNHSAYSAHSSPYQNGAPPFRPTAYPPAYNDNRYEASQPPQNNGFGSSLPPMALALENAYVHPPNPTTQLYTRNLIGSLCASAFKLKDDKGTLGIWFVLQDLSVRTEGWFRLKMNFFDLSKAVEKQILEATTGATSANSDDSKNAAPCLASTFSNPFKVFSAKKFPGVVESTELSKAFANQGIKIPIRKDTDKKRGRGDGSGDEDGLSDPEE